MKNRIILFFSLILLCAFSLVHAEKLSLKTNHPTRYVVKQGDTLWGIASRFLNKPWQWRQIWRNNPHIKNPDHLYPGAVLELKGGKGHYALAMTRRGTVRLSPKVRKKPIDQAIPTIPLSMIKPFLVKGQVFSEDELADAAYVVEYGGTRLMGSSGDKIYVKNLHPFGKGGYDSDKFAIYRQEGEFLDPSTKELIGYDAKYIGDANLVDDGEPGVGEPATMMITSIRYGVKIGDRVIPNNLEGFDPFFEPHAPDVAVDGVIIQMFGGITQVGKDQVVVINKGDSEGMTVGDVLAIDRANRAVPDPYMPKEEVVLPTERIGELMVFRVFEHVSFALVMRATQPVRKMDIVSNPT